jgi:hypothetical protein
MLAFAGYLIRRRDFTGRYVHFPDRIRGPHRGGERVHRNDLCVTRFGVWSGIAIVAGGEPAIQRRP